MPDLWMDVDAALAEVPVNIMPLIDDTDFKSIEDAVAYNATGIALNWHFVTCAGAYTVTAVTPTTGGNYDWTDQGTAGIYTIEIPASGGASINNDTEGVGWFTGKATGILPWRGPTIGFRRAALNDLLIEGSTASTNLEDFFDGTGYAGGTAKLQVDTTLIEGSDATNQIRDAVVDDSTRIDASALNTLSSHDPGEAIMGATDLGTGSGFTAIPWNASWDAEVQSECNDALVAIHLDHLLAEDYDPASKPGTATALLNEIVENDGGVSRFTVNALENAPSGSGASAETIADAVWDEALSGHTGAGTAGKALADAQSAGDPWATALPGSYGDGTAGKIIGDNVNAPIGTVDTVVDAIKAKTDSLTFTVAGDVDVNVQTWKGSAAADMTGDAFARLGAPAGVSVSADIAAIEAQTDDIGAAGAGLTAVPWNAAWDAEVQSECTDALNAYDPPTNAEMEARTLVSAGYASPTNITAGTITTVTNLTNAPSNGDFTATMKESITAAVPTTAQIQTEMEENGASLLDTIRDNLQHATYGLSAIRTRGDAAWVTATGFSTLTAQQVWEYATRVLTAGTNLSIPSAADIKTAMEAAGGHLALILEDTGTTLDGKIDTIDGIVDAILVDTGTTLDTALEVIKRATVYKKILTFDGDDEGNLQLFDTNNSSLGTIVDAFTEDATTKTQKALVPPA